MKLAYRHCLWCNGIFLQRKKIQKFCSDKCRNRFSQNVEIHCGMVCGPFTNPKVYYKKPSKEIIAQYPESSIM